MVPETKYPQRTPQEMESNWVVRHDQLESQANQTAQRFPLVGESTPGLPAFITEPHRFLLDKVKVQSGERFEPGVYDSETVLFVASGQWRVYWGNEPGVSQGETEMEQWDIFSIPSGVSCGFENLGSEDAWMLIAKGRG